MICGYGNLNRSIWSGTATRVGAVCAPWDSTRSSLSAPVLAQRSIGAGKAGFWFLEPDRRGFVVLSKVGRTIRATGDCLLFFQHIRAIVREAVDGTKHERRVATASTIAGVERMARYDPAVVVQPDALDADPWLLNTQSGIVDLRDGSSAPHDPAALIIRITTAAPADAEGEELWSRFLTDITQGDTELSAYLRRLVGYCATRVTSEDILPYLFGVGSNGKSSFAEALTAALGDYALVFAPEVMMEAKGERHPTELAQFMGVRLALCNEPSSSAIWNDSRVKSLTGDATISAGFQRFTNRFRTNPESC